MEGLTIETILNAGPIPLLAVIAGLLWRIDKSQAVLSERQEIRDQKLETIHEDLRAVIRRLAGIEDK